MSLPLLSKGRSFSSVCRRLGLTARSGMGRAETFEISSSLRVGASPADNINAIIKGCQELISLEMSCESGEEAEFAEHLRSYATKDNDTENRSDSHHIDLASPPTCADKEPSCI